MISDWTNAFYLGILICCFYGFIIFGLRTFKAIWIKIKYGSHMAELGPVFIYLWLLFLGLILQIGGSYYVRALFLKGWIIEQQEALNSWWWYSRTILLFSIVLFMSIHQTWRMFAKKQKRLPRIVCDEVRDIIMRNLTDITFHLNRSKVIPEDFRKLFKTHRKQIEEVLNRCRENRNNE